ncbi:MAG: hypothetical protein C4325_09520 [Blastocatellia bacterium]
MRKLTAIAAVTSLPNISERVSSLTLVTVELADCAAFLFSTTSLRRPKRAPRSDRFKTRLETSNFHAF